MPSIVDPAATRTCLPTQAQGNFTEWTHGTDEAAPVETSADRCHPPVVASFLPQVHAPEGRSGRSAVALRAVTAGHAYSCGSWPIRTLPVISPALNTIWRRPTASE